jgi:hypothetical protein
MFTDRLQNGFYKDLWEHSQEDSNQLEMEFLWPHRAIQLSLDLDTEGCDTRHTRQKLYAVPANYSFGVVNPHLGMTTINSTLSVSPTNSVGELSIGGVNIGVEKKPSVLQKVMYKLLGFKWKNNE